MGKDSSYANEFNQYLDIFRRFSDKTDTIRLEHHFECLKDWNKFHSISEIKSWFNNRRNDCKMEISEIPLIECENWIVDPKTMNVTHESGEFFSIHGIRIKIDTREVGKGGWDQPILTQIGFDGGLLGIIRQRFEGIPHYLIEAKAEPGNYGKLQLSPTLQATFSNLKRAHKGSKPLFSEYFETPEKFDCSIMYNQWLSEDGGRLYLKRNRGMMVEVDEGTITKIPDGFIWLSMWQIKELLNEDSWINPHVRGIIANL